MSTLPHGPQRCSSVQDEVNAWLLVAHERPAQLHRHGTGAWASPTHQEAFAEMSLLLLETFEAVRVVSAQLREHSQALSAKTTALRERSAMLIARRAGAPHGGEPFAPPIA